MEDIDLLHGKTSYANAFEVHIKTVEQKMQEYEPWAQIIDSVVNELQDISVDSEFSSINAWWKHRWNNGNTTSREMLPMIQTGQVSKGYIILEQFINYEAPVFTDSVKITQYCTKKHEYKTILQSGNEK